MNTLLNHEVFGITLPAFRIAGGILVFMVGYHMLSGEHSTMHHPKNLHEINDSKPDTSIAISPLAVPIFAGPGTIATAMNYSAKGSYTEVVITIVAFALICALPMCS